jgi:hypothetical protein
VTRGTHTVKSGRILTVSLSLAALGVALAGPSACTEPAVRCTAQAGEGIARYTVVGPAPDPTACAAATIPGTTNADPGTFPIGVESYVPTPADPNASNEVGSMALQPEWLGARLEDAMLNASQDQSLTKDVRDAMAKYPYGTGTVPAPPPDGPPSTNFPYAWGKFDTVFPDSNGLCKVSNMQVSDVDYPDIPAHNAGVTVASPLGSPTYVQGGSYLDCSPAPGPGPTVCQTGEACVSVTDPTDPTEVKTLQRCELPIDDNPETKVKYAWTNVRTYVSSSFIGVQTFANLTVTQDGCSVSYQVSLLVPRVSCADANGKKEQSLCDPNADGPDNPSGSGIIQGLQPSCENISPDPANPDWECLPPVQDPFSKLQ